MSSAGSSNKSPLQKGASMNAFGGTDSGSIGDPWEFLSNATLDQGLQCTNACLLLKSKADADPNWLNENVDKFVTLLSSWAKKFNFEGESLFFELKGRKISRGFLSGGMMDPMVGPVTNLTLLFNLHSVHVLPTTWTKILPVYIALMSKKSAPPHMKQGLGSTFVVVKMQKPQVRNFEALFVPSKKIYRVQS